MTKVQFTHKNNLILIILISLLFLSSLFIRLNHVLVDRETDRNGIGLFGDTHQYHRLAYNLYAGNGYSMTYDARAYGLLQATPIIYEPAITRGPGYPFFMAFIYKFFCNKEDMQDINTWYKNWDKVRIAQCVLDSFVGIFVFFIVWNISSGSTLSSSAASILYVFSVYNIYYTKTLLSESLTTFFLTASVLFFIIFLKDNRKLFLMLAGILLGFTILCRQEYLLFVFFLSMYLFWKSKTYFKTALTLSFIFIISAIVVIAPWTYRNYVFFKKPVLISEAPIGYNLYLGTFESKETWTGWGEYPDYLYKDMNEKNKVKMLDAALNESLYTGSAEYRKIDNEFLNLAFKQIKAHPWSTVYIWISRLPRLWYQNYIHMAGKPEPSGIYFISYFILAIIAYFKMDNQKRARAFPIVILFLTLSFIFLPQHVEPRYGASAMPSIISLAGLGLGKLLNAFV